MNWSRAVTVPRRPSDLKTEFPGLPPPLALCHCVAGLWEHHSRLSLDRQSMLPKVGQVWEELWHQRPLLRCLQVKVIVQKRATLSSKAGKHHNALGGGGGRSNQNGKHSSPLRRQPLFYILPLSLKWAIAFLPRRLRRAMKAKVLQRCSTHLQIYNKIQHDNFFFPGKSLERQSSSSLSASILVFNTLRNMESQRWREKQNQTKNKIETEEKNKTPKQSLITTKTVGEGWGGRKQPQEQLNICQKVNNWCGLATALPCR